MTAQQALAMDDTAGVPFVTTFHSKPWRHYQVHPGQTDVDAALDAKKGIRVPSVTQVGGKTIDKSGALKGWAQRETVDALNALHAQYGADDGIFRDPERLEAAILAYGREINAAAFVELYESQQSTLPWGYPEDLLRLVKQSEESMNAKMKAAQTRGTTLHDALEEYGKTGKPFNPDDYPNSYRGYFQALASWLMKYRPTFHGSEIVVGSLRHRFGGRLDHHITLDARKGMVDSYGAALEGRGLIDLKTGKGVVYPVENFTQVEAYELAAVESGQPATDFRAVLAIGPDGSYEFRKSVGQPEDFLSALAWFNRQKRIEKDAKAAAKAGSSKEGSK